MALFREEYSTIQNDYVNVDPAEESENDDLEYSNDDLGENTEITPLGDAVEKEVDVDNYNVGPGDDEDGFDDDEVDTDLDLDTEEVEDEEIVDLAAISPDEDDDLVDDDDDLLDDDDDLDEPLIAPDLDDDDDFLDDDDDLDEDEPGDDEPIAETPKESIPTGNVTNRHSERSTGRMVDHEPGLPGFERSF